MKTEIKCKLIHTLYFNVSLVLNYKEEPKEEPNRTRSQRVEWSRAKQSVEGWMLEYEMQILRLNIEENVRHYDEKTHVMNLNDLRN